MLPSIFYLGQHITNFRSKIFDNDLDASYYLSNITQVIAQWYQDVQLSPLMFFRQDVAALGFILPLEKLLKIAKTNGTEKTISFLPSPLPSLCLLCPFVCTFCPSSANVHTRCETSKGRNICSLLQSQFRVPFCLGVTYHVTVANVRCYVSGWHIFFSLICAGISTLFSQFMDFVGFCFGYLECGLQIQVAGVVCSSRQQFWLCVFIVNYYVISISGQKLNYFCMSFSQFRIVLFFVFAFIFLFSSEFFLLEVKKYSQKFTFLQ